jgi:hypothetical protein
MPGRRPLQTKEDPAKFKTRAWGSTFMDHEVHGDKILSFPRPSYEMHLKNDAQIRRLISKRAGALVEAGALNIVPREFRERRGNIHAVSEFRPVHSLDEFLKTASRNERGEAFRSIMEQLAHLHSRANVAHLDLYDLRKGASDNVVMWKGKVPHFTDFGIGMDLRQGRGLVSYAPSKMLDDINDVITVFCGGRFEPPAELDLRAGLEAYSRILRESLGEKLFGSLRGPESETMSEALDAMRKKYLT